MKQSWEKSSKKKKKNENLESNLDKNWGSEE